MTNGRGRDVLVADGQPVVIKIAQKFLGRRPNVGNVIAARDGTKIIRTVKGDLRGDIGLVLTEVNTPNISGPEAALRIFKSKGDAAPLLLMRSEAGMSAQDRRMIQSLLPADHVLGLFLNHSLPLCHWTKQIDNLLSDDEAAKRQAIAYFAQATRDSVLYLMDMPVSDLPRRFHPSDS